MKLSSTIIKSILLVFLMFVFIDSKASASSLLFEDAFSQDTNKWVVEGTPGWVLQNGEYGFTGTGISNSIPSDLHWNNDWNNFVFTADLRGDTGTDKNLVFRYVDENNFYSVHHTGGYIHFEKFINTQSGAIPLAAANYYPLENGITYHFELTVNGDRFTLKESNNLLFDVEDTNEPRIQSGKVGLRVGGGAIVWYDNVVVSSLDGEELVSLDVPDLKQYSPPWNDDIYDDATKWSDNPTIESWGCALTSAAMVLGFHGFEIDPDELNDWLNSRPDGYIGNGLVNWLAISRYTKQNPIEGIEALEFNRHPYSSEKLLEELEGGRPSILKEPGHFVVAKSQTVDSFGINDPGYSDRPTLASYSNTAQNLYSYTPSSTDLSYILLTLNAGFGLTVKDPDGNEIEGSYWIEEPLVDDPGETETSGPPLGIFMYPKPANGNYMVTVQGEGLYELDAYLYDEDGNVLLKNYNGFGGDMDDEYLITIDEDNSISFPLGNIINDLDQVYLDGQFHNFGVYNSLRNQLLKVEEFINDEQFFNAKILLDSVLLRLVDSNELGSEPEMTTLRNQIQNYYDTL